MSRNEFYSVDDSVRQFLIDLPNLLMLDLSYTSISDSSLRSIGTYSYNLQLLKLEQCTNFTSKGLYYLSTGRGARLLRHINLSGCLQLTTQGLQTFARGSRHLKTLILNDLFCLEDDAFSELVTRTGRINSISLLNGGSLSNQGLIAIQNCLQLTHLKISHNLKITDLIGQLALKKLNRLTELTLTDCPNIGDRTVKAIGGLQGLQKVNLSRCEAITDVGLRILLDGPSGSSLKTLELCNLTQLTDISLLRMSQRCHSLVELDVSLCQNLSDSGFELLANIKNLQTVSCRGTLLSNHGAQVLGDMKKVRNLSFSECQLIQDWEKVMRKINPNIDKVDFSIIKSLNNNGIKEMAFNCRQISHINIQGCIELNDLAVQYISGVCRHLSYINISGIPNVSKRSIRFLKKVIRIIELT